ncbi:MAG: YraN family protein [Bacillota bacterium]|jgi:putative endonuclease|nr:YraN family protein [Bacillota bacterium]
MERRKMGELGEKLAADYLKKNNCRVLASNYRAGRIGEIDLVVSDHEAISFIEVKTRTGKKYGTPAEAVTYAKQMTIRRVAMCFLKEKGLINNPVRFDVIEVMLTKEGKVLSINHLKNAF